ncbi:MAG TPA: tRNA-specific adenosine deaminase [Bacteroidales bacterium]|nr:tRNA-specific adenosine deaminase [Bacteroidales bacterium]
MNDEFFLSKAIAMAAENVLAGGGPFGAIIVKDGEIIGMGANKVTPSSDPTAHAEIVAIRDACKNIGDFRLNGSVLYTSCEPCPMCLGAIYWAHIERIVYAANKNDAANAGFDDSFIYEQFALPSSQRSIKAVNLRMTDSCLPFETWKRLESKIEY